MLERQLAEFLEGTTDAAFAANLQGIIRTWNKAAEKLIGYPAEYAIGRPCAEIIGGAVGPGKPVCYEFCDILESVRKGREVSNYDMEVKTSSGQSVWVNVSLLITFNERTERRYAVHLMRDITDRKKADELTNKMMRMARDLVAGTEASNLTPIAPLTPQEVKILRLLATGKNTAGIVAERQISVRTLRNHIVKINQKLHTKTRTEAVMQAYMRGLI